MTDWQPSQNTKWNWKWKWSWKKKDEKPNGGNAGSGPDRTKQNNVWKAEHGNGRTHARILCRTHIYITAAHKQGERLSNNPYPCWDFQNDLCPQINVHTRNERFADIAATLEPCPNHIVFTCSAQIITIINGIALTKHWNNDRIHNESAKCCFQKRENKVRTLLDTFIWCILTEFQLCFIFIMETVFRAFLMHIAQLSKFHLNCLANFSQLNLWAQNNWLSGEKKTRALTTEIVFRMKYSKYISLPKEIVFMIDLWPKEMQRECNHQSINSSSTGVWFVVDIQHHTKLCVAIFMIPCFAI